MKAFNDESLDGCQIQTDHAGLCSQGTRGGYQAYESIWYDSGLVGYGWFIDTVVDARIVMTAIQEEITETATITKMRHEIVTQNHIGYHL